MKVWKTISSKTILAHKRLTVYEDVVELPNGHRTDYIHFGKGMDAANIIAINDENKILVLKEYSYPPHEWLYQFPGGAIEPGEDPTKGALRELAEEGGQTGELEELGWYYIENRRRKDKLYVYRCTNLQLTEAANDVEEEFEAFWLTADEIDRLISNGAVANYSMLASWALFKASSFSR